MFDPPESGEDGDLDLSLPGVARVVLEDLDGHDLVGAFFPALGHLEGGRGQGGDGAREDTEESDEDTMGLNTPVRQVITMMMVVFYRVRPRKQKLLRYCPETEDSLHRADIF